MPRGLEMTVVLKQFHLMACLYRFILYSRDLTMVERALNHPDHICTLLSLSLSVETGGYGIILL